MVQPLEHDAAKIHRRFRATLKCNLHDPPLHRGGFIIARDIISTHLSNITSAPLSAVAALVAATKSSVL